MTVARFPFLSLVLVLAGTPCVAQAQRAPEVRLPGGVMPAGVAITVNPADTLAQNLRILAANPRDIQALTQAGLSAIEVGDPNAALGFLGRAEQLSPSNGYVKAALGAALVNLERGTEAMAFFRQAAALGVPEVQFAKDRGLAFDLAGDPRQAQRDYLTALRAGPDAETTRRLALSYGISGDRDQALRLLEPLVQRQDQGAWRARAFVLAMSGDQRGAERIVQQVMPVGMGTTMTSFMRQLPGLNASARAHAVNFGTMPTSSPIFAAAMPMEPLRPISGAMTDSLTREEAAAPVLLMESNEGRRKNSKAKRRRPGRDDELLAAAPPAPVAAPAPARPRSDSALTARQATSRRDEPKGESLAEASVRIAAVRDEAIRNARRQGSTTFEIPTLVPAAASIPAPAPRKPVLAAASSMTPAASPQFVEPATAVPVRTAAAPTPTPAPVFEIPSTPRPAPAIIAAQTSTNATVAAPSPSPTFVATAPARPTLTPAPAATTPAPTSAQQLAPASVAALEPKPVETLATPVPQAGFSAAVLGGVAPPPAPVTSPILAPPPIVTASKPDPAPALVNATAAPAIASSATIAPVSPPPAVAPAASTALAVATPNPAATTALPRPSEQAGLVSTGPRPLMGPPVPDGIVAAVEPVASPASSSALATAPAETIPEATATVVAQAQMVNEAVPQGTAPSEDIGLNGLLDDLTPEAERAAGAVLGDAEFRKARLAAKRKADAEAKEKAQEDAALTAKKEEEEAKKRELAKSPPRIWVQVATGSSKSGIGLTMRKVRDQAGETLSRYGSATVPYKATNRLLVGPFGSEAEARKAVTALAKKGVAATTFTSSAGQEVSKLASK